jgi:hypothetical protein
LKLEPQSRFTRQGLIERANRKLEVLGLDLSGYATNQDLASQNVPTSLLTQNNFRFARHPPKDDYEAAEDSNVVRANGQIKKLLRRVRYHF